MGQYAQVRQISLRFLAVVIVAVMAGCQKRDSTPSTAPAHTRTIASVVPAATDILMEMGAADHLVGISNYDPQIPELASFPRVGDYHVIDWEKLSQIRPSALVIQRPKQDMAPVFKQRADTLGIELVDIHMDRLDEIYPVIEKLGQAIGENQKAQALIAGMRKQLANARAQAADKPKVRTLLALDHTASGVVGPRNYLDDILTIAGGVNVAATGEKDYPQIDREKLLQLNPDAIIVFLPQAPPQVVESAKTFFAGLPQLKAVHDGRIYIHTDWFLTLPTARSGDVAQIVANDLHPLTASSQPTTTVAQ